MTGWQTLSLVNLSVRQLHKNRLRFMLCQSLRWEQVPFSCCDCLSDCGQPKGEPPYYWTLRAKTGCRAIKGSQCDTDTESVFWVCDESCFSSTGKDNKVVSWKVHCACLCVLFMRLDTISAKSWFVSLSWSISLKKFRYHNCILKIHNKLGSG